MRHIHSNHHQFLLWEKRKEEDKERGDRLNNRIFFRAAPILALLAFASLLLPFLANESRWRAHISITMDRGRGGGRKESQIAENANMAISTEGAHIDQWQSIIECILMFVLLSWLYLRTFVIRFFVRK